MRRGHGARGAVSSRLVMWGGAGLAGATLLVLLGLGLNEASIWIAGIVLIAVCVASCVRMWLVDRRAERDLHAQLERMARQRGR